MQIPERIEVDSETASCDGGGVGGHPLVYLDIGAEGRVVCPYCSREFVLSRGAGRQPGH